MPGWRHDRGDRVPAAAAYLAAVERELADLPVEERAELLEDLGLHLQSIEEEADDRSLESRLGSAQAYAAELRTAAGLPPRGRQKSQVEERVAVAIAWLTHRWSVGGLREFLTQLRPGWWVLRGYLAVEVISLLRQGTGSYARYLSFRTRHDFPLPAPLGSHLLGALLVIVAIVGSVKLGRARLPRLGAGAIVVANLALLVGTLSLADLANDRLHAPTSRVYVTSPIPGPLTSWNRPITNIFPFAADGTPLKGVLLYDQDGRPVKSDLQQWWPDHCARVLGQPRAADGVPVPQSFPQLYVLDPRGITLNGLPVVAGQCRPLVGPKVQLPRFAK